MPEAYTHLRTAYNALHYAKLDIYDKACFTLGSAGPDTFFCYKAWQKNPTPNLSKFGGEMHQNNIQSFLLSMIKNSHTDAQKAYTMGFLCHWVTDSIVHPYVEFITTNGNLYDIKGGHGFFEIALDSLLFKKDYGKRTKFYKITNPQIKTTKLAEITSLLNISIKQAFGKSFPLDAIADSFHHSYFLHHLFYSGFGIKRKFLYLIEKFILKKEGFVTVHIMPQKIKGELPATWLNPFTSTTQNDSVPALLEKSYKQSSTVLTQCNEYWNNQISLEELANVVTDKSYVSGI